MAKNLVMCGVESTYLDYLREFDGNVSKDPKKRRKFVGILFEIGDHLYCAPLSSPKPKHQTMSDKAPDIYKIDGGVLGLINLNNMIPVLESTIVSVDIDNEPDKKYKELMTDQIILIRKDEELIKKKARKLYQIVKSNKQPKLNERCCKYQLLEGIASQYGQADSITLAETAAAPQHNLD